MLNERVLHHLELALKSSATIRVVVLDPDHQPQTIKGKVKSLNVDTFVFADKESAFTYSTNSVIDVKFGGDKIVK